MPASDLRELYPWPAERPRGLREDLQGWFGDGHKRVLSARLSDSTRCVVELGSWKGLSTRFILETAPFADVYAVDHWKGSAEHFENPEWAKSIPTLYDQFLFNLWGYRDRLIPVRESTLDGIALIADAGIEPDLVYIDGIALIADAGIEPDLVYIDADHSTASVLADLAAVHDRFPAAHVTGDDWMWDSVRTAVEQFARDRNRDIRVYGNVWELVRRKPREQ